MSTKPRVEITMPAKLYEDMMHLIDEGRYSSKTDFIVHSIRKLVDEENQMFSEDAKTAVHSLTRAMRGNATDKEKKLWKELLNDF